MERGLDKRKKRGENCEGKESKEVDLLKGGKQREYVKSLKWFKRS